MRSTVARIYRFRATHSLPDFPEPWCFPHQHDYTVEVVAKGGTSTDLLDEFWRDRGFDGANLNCWFVPSTVENIAETLLSAASKSILSVMVWEDRQRWGKAER